MANLSVLNRLMKVQKLLLTINGANGASSGGSLGLAGHTFATATVVNQQQRQRLHQKHTVTTVGQQKRTQRYTLTHAYSTTSTSATDSQKSGATTTLDEFRAREQAELHREDEKEQEHQQNSSTEDDAKRAKADEVRTLILDAALEHIPEHGWTRQAIICGAEDAGYPSVVHGMFPEGGFALVAHFNGKCNKKLVQHLDEITEGGNKEITNPPEFLVNAVRMRLDMLTPYKAQWPQALALIALPQNASTALAQLLTLVDDICFYSGDRSVDIGWYTRRIGLGTIFKMTELYMLQDTSPQHSSTWEFLENRMEEAVQLQTVLMQTGDMTSRFQRSFNSAFITARNILGLGYQRD